MMELRQLACFVAAAEELNFSRAADRMHISQPPFSRQIANLERELGARLLERSSRTVSLTPAGANLLLAGEIDLGFIRQPVLNPKLEMRSLLKEPFVVAVPANHLFAQREHIELSAIADEDLVSFSREQAPAIHLQLLKMCEESGFAPRIVQEVYPMSTLVGLVASGIGVAIVPESMSRLNILDVVYVPLSGTAGRSELLMVWRAGDQSSVLGNFLAM